MRGFVRQHLLGARVHLLAVHDGHADPAVILAAAPLRGVGGFLVGIAGLHDGDDLFLGVATQLRGNAREGAVDDRHHGAGRFGGDGAAVVTQHHPYAVQAFAALIVAPFLLHLLIQSLDIGVGREIERLRQ